MLILLWGVVSRRRTPSFLIWRRLLDWKDPRLVSSRKTDRVERRDYPRLYWIGEFSLVSVTKFDRQWSRRGKSSYLLLLDWRSKRYSSLSLPDTWKMGCKGPNESLDRSQIRQSLTTILGCIRSVNPQSLLSQLSTWIMCWSAVSGRGDHLGIVFPL